MPRIAYPEQTMTGPGMLGATPLNVERMLHHLPPGQHEKFRELARALVWEGKLDPGLRELAILRVGHLSDAPYEIHHHEHFARDVGVSPEKIAAVGDDIAAAVFEPAEQAVLAFIDEMVRNVRAGDATLQALQLHLSSSEILELIAVSGFYMVVCRILENFGVEIET